MHNWHNASQIWSRRAGLCTLILTWCTVKSRISHTPTSGTRRQTWGPTVRRTVKRLDKLVGTPVRFISSLTFLFLHFSFLQKHILQGCRDFDVTVCNTVKSDLKKKKVMSEPEMLLLFLAFNFLIYVVKPQTHFMLLILAICSVEKCDIWFDTYSYFYVSESRYSCNRKEICIMLEVFKVSLMFALVAPSLLYQSLTSTCICARKGASIHY